MGKKKRKKAQDRAAAKQKLNPAESVSAQKPKLHLWHITLIIALGLLIYSSSLPNQFVWDDEYGVERNFLIRSWSNFPLAFKSVLYPGVDEAHNFYRPLQTLSFFWDYGFWKLNPLGYHLTNIILHILAALSLYYFLNLLSKKTNFSLAIALLFLAHPIHTEAVSYISGRADPLALIFVLLCFSFYILFKRQRRILFYFLSLLSFLISILAKESVIFLPILLICYFFYFSDKKNDSLAKELKYLSGFIALIILYILMRRAFVGIDVQTNTWLAKTGQSVRVFTAFKIVAIYIGLLIFPYPLFMERRINFIRSFFEPQAFFSFLLICFLVWLIFFLRRWKPLAGYGLLWFLLGLAPVLNIFLPLNAMLAEHWLYFPSIGLIIFAVLLSEAALRRLNIKWLPRSAFIAALAIFSMLTFKQNFAWRDDLAIYAHTARLAPYSDRAQNNVGKALLDRGRIEEAEVYFKKTLELDPNYLDALVNLGNVYAAQKKLKLAEEHYQKALKINPRHISAHVNLGALYVDQERLKDAEQEFKQVFTVNETVPEAHNNLANVYAHMGRYTEAIGEYQRALELGLEFAEIHANMAFVYQQLNQYQQAELEFEKANQLKPGLLGLKEAMEANKKYLQLAPLRPR